VSGSLEVLCHTVGPFVENCYLMVGPSGKKAAIVDPGVETEFLADELDRRGLELEWIINTHAHLDHVACNHFFKERTNAPIILHRDDLPLLKELPRQGEMFGIQVKPSPAPDAWFEEGQPFVFDGLNFDVLHTPGHSPGGVCLRHGEVMWVGDTLFQGSIGRTDLFGGSLEELTQSIRGKLFSLPGATRCFPGHGPATTLDAEQRTNPFVGDAAIAAGGQDIS